MKGPHKLRGQHGIPRVEAHGGTHSLPLNLYVQSLASPKPRLELKRAREEDEQEQSAITVNELTVKMVPYHG